jgi:tripartite-type tricarboxylate transporter receptor subunit TctC
MKRLGISLVVVVAFASMLIGTIGQAAPAPATPSKAVELAQAAGSATKAGYPAPGKTVTVIVPYSAGGGTGIAAVEMSALLEKDLKTPFQVVYKPGAGAQIGLTELVRAKPDGYTIGWVGNPTAVVTYLDPDRKAVYTRKSFQPVGMHFTSPCVMAVLATSPYKTIKDLIDAAKAKPGTIKVGTMGLMTSAHQAGLLLEQAAGVKFAYVHFDGDSPAATAQLGGHIDLTFHAITGIIQHIKSGAISPLAVMDSEESAFLPGVKTLAALGYKVEMGVYNGVNAPAGIPHDALDALTQAIKRNISRDDHIKKMDQLGYTLRYLDPERYAALWAQLEDQTRPLMEQAKKQ